MRATFPSFFLLISFFFVEKIANLIMVIHVGLNPDTGGLSYYDESENKMSNYGEKNRKFDFAITKVNCKGIEKVSKMFDEIKLKISGNFGCLCICLDALYENEIRKKFIESGLKAGFRNVGIINPDTAYYLNALSQINYKPLNGEIIWIQYIYFFYLWQIIDQKAKFIGEWKADPSKIRDLQKIIKESKSNRGPNIVLFDDEKTDKKNFIKISKCQFFNYKWHQQWSSIGSLLKARITGGDKDIAHLNNINFLSQEITLILGERNVVCYKYGHQLPIFFSKNQEDDLLIITKWNDERYFELPNYAEVFLTFQIDQNEICYVAFNEWPNIEWETAETSSINHFIIPKINTSLDMKFKAIGIDLGTSRCCAAVNRKNGIQTMPLGNIGERLLPSYVAYDEPNVKCGQVVIDRLRHWAKFTVFDSKRIIGRKMGDIEIDSNWSFQIVSENNEPLIKVKGFDGVKHLKAEEVSAELLKYIKQKAEDFQGIPLFNAVITVPAAFTEEQKNATIEAAKIAGWKNIHLLPEPVAASFAYFIDHPAIENSTVLLFDLGGGTLDVCIFKIATNEIEIISNTGDTKLGGRDFDTVLINHFTNLLSTKYGITIKDEKKYKLMIKCQQIKETLSMLFSCGLDIDEFDPSQDGMANVTRIEYEKMTTQLYNRIRNTLNSALFNSSFQANEIEKVLLVGGGSRMPMIKQLLQEIFPNAQQCCHENPDEVVAIGAAYFACNNVF